MAWPGDQSSSYGGGGASTAQEPVTKEPPAAAVEEEATPEQIPKPSLAPAHAPDDATPVVELE